jgi:hypothetical protein
MDSRRRIVRGIDHRRCAGRKLESFKIQSKFIHDLLNSVDPGIREFLVGDPKKVKKSPSDSSSWGRRFMRTLDKREASSARLDVRIRGHDKQGGLLFESLSSGRSPP